jgi:hypothetical protein
MSAMAEISRDHQCGTAPVVDGVRRGTCVEQ